MNIFGISDTFLSFHFLLLLRLLTMALTSASDTGASNSGAVLRSNARFTSEFYSILKKSRPTSNLIFSPFSLSACVGMIKAGAGGVTAEEIRKSMHYPEDRVLFSGFRGLLEGLRSNENFTLETANSVYTKAGFRLSTKFETLVRDSFGARVEQLDFIDGAKSARKINDFVQRVTQDKIKDLVSPDDLTEYTRLVLVNAIYFKGLWKHPFDEKLTAKEVFHIGPGRQAQVDMMKTTEIFWFGELQELDARAISLPYKGDRLSMILILPNKEDGLPELESKLTAFDLGSVQTKLHQRRVQLWMPKFRLESEIDLQGPLETLGMRSLFGPRADLRGIHDFQDEPLFVSKAVQKAFLEVNEEGSEAAAATGFTVRTRRSAPELPEMFIASHPFLLYVMARPKPESEELILLFNGAFVDPSGTMPSSKRSIDEL